MTSVLMTCWATAGALAARSARSAAVKPPASFTSAAALKTSVFTGTTGLCARALSQKSLHFSARVFNAGATGEHSTFSPQSNDDQPAPQRFDSVESVHTDTARAIKNVFKYDTMSPVQATILGKLPTDRDMFVKAKTGTGKTLAFLIPAMETLIKRRAARNDKRGSIIIISPTRELAMQIAVEADKLCKYHDFAIHELIGGNSKRSQISSLERYPSDIIIGTPGRLRDLMDSSKIFQQAVKDNEVLILDEADRLLEMGFRDEIQDIISFFPKSRQTLLFSATVPREVREVANLALRDDHEFIDLVPANEKNVHLHIPQRYAIHNTAKLPELVHRIIQENKDKKVMMFLPTTKATELYAQFLTSAGVRVYELHSGKPQYTRTTTSDRFRRSRDGVLVTTDVSARGIDYPDVHLILQVGIPISRDQYIHRIGRTGRAGKGGSALLVLSPWEKGFLKFIADLPIEACSDWSSEAMASKHNEGKLEDPDGDRTRKLAAQSVSETMVRDCIMSLCGFYSSRHEHLNTRIEEIPGHLASISAAFNVPAPDLRSLNISRGFRRPNMFSSNYRDRSYFGGGRVSPSGGGSFGRMSTMGGGGSFGRVSTMGGGGSFGRVSTSGGGRERRSYDEDSY